MSGLRLRLMPASFAVCRLAPHAPLPDWLPHSGWYSVTRTADELSIIAEDHLVPAELDCQRGWRGLGVEGPLDFNAVGIMAGLSQALASAGISLLAIATHDTDYILVRETDLAQALAALDQANYLVQPEGTAP